MILSEARHAPPEEIAILPGTSHDGDTVNTNLVIVFRADQKRLYVTVYHMIKVNVVARGMGVLGRVFFEIGT